jgi:diketogulonate reductase-like aldo/keto reductase
VIIRWHFDNGFVVIPKSATPARIVENHDVFGFSLDDHDMARSPPWTCPAASAFRPNRSGSESDRRHARPSRTITRSD